MQPPLMTLQRVLLSFDREDSLPYRGFESCSAAISGPGHGAADAR